MAGWAGGASCENIWVNAPAGVSGDAWCNEARAVSTCAGGPIGGSGAEAGAAEGSLWSAVGGASCENIWVNAPAGAAADGAGVNTGAGGTGAAVGAAGKGTSRAVADSRAEIALKNCVNSPEGACGRVGAAAVSGLIAGGAIGRKIWVNSPDTGGGGAGEDTGAASGGGTVGAIGTARVTGVNKTV